MSSEHIEVDTQGFVESEDINVISQIQLPKEKFYRENIINNLDKIQSEMSAYWTFLSDTNFIKHVSNPHMRQESYNNEEYRFRQQCEVKIIDNMIILQVDDDALSKFAPPTNRKQPAVYHSEYILPTEPGYAFIDNISKAFQDVIDQVKENAFNSQISNIKSSNRELLEKQQDRKRGIREAMFFRVGEAKFGKFFDYNVDPSEELSKTKRDNLFKKYLSGNSKTRKKLIKSYPDLFTEKNIGVILGSMKNGR